MVRRRRTIQALILLLVTGFAGEAWAQDVEEAKRQKARAFELIAEGSYQAGIDALEKAYEAAPHPTFLFNIAVTYDQWRGHCRESLDAFERFFAECKGCQVEATARKRYEAVAKRCEVRLTIESTPPGAQVSIDGEGVGQTPVTTKRPVGRYEIAAQLESYEPEKRTVELVEGEAQTLALALKPVPPAPVEVPAKAPPPSVVPTAQVESDDGGGINLPAYVSLGVGGVAAVVGVIFGLDSNASADDAAEAELEDPPIRDDILEYRQDSKDAALSANISYAVALVGIGLGVSLLLLDTMGSSDDADSSQDSGPAVELGPDWRVRF